MQNCMTIWAHRSKIIYRVNVILLANRRDFHEMVNVNKTSADFAVRFLKVHPAHYAMATVSPYYFMLPFKTCRR